MTPAEIRLLCAEADPEEATGALARAGLGVRDVRAALEVDDPQDRRVGLQHVDLPVPGQDPARLSVLVPDTGTRRPGALLVLHWSGGTGEEALDWFAPLARRLGMVLLCPTAQRPAGRAEGLDLAGLAGGRFTRPAWGSGGTGVPEAALRWARYRLGVDPDRCAVTGVSMGGIATWGLALRLPDTLAAAAPINGALSMWELFGTDRRTRGVLPNVLDLSLLVVHGGEDRQIPAAFDAESAATLRSLGHPRLEYLQVAGGEHTLDSLGFADGDVVVERLVAVLGGARRGPVVPSAQVITSASLAARRAWFIPRDPAPHGLGVCRARVSPGLLDVVLDGCSAADVHPWAVTDHPASLQVRVNGVSVETVRRRPDLATLVRTYRQDADPRSTADQVLRVIGQAVSSAPGTQAEVGSC